MTHGKTLCTRCKFEDVLQAVNECAFAASPLPIFISLEMHCSLPQQRRCAAMLREIFGAALLLLGSVIYAYASRPKWYFTKPTERYGVSS